MTSDREDRRAVIPLMSTTERDARWSSLRERMYQRQLDALVIWGSNFNRGLGNANLRYVTHVPASAWGIAVFPLRGDPVVFGEMHHSHVPYSLYDRYQDWVADTRPLEGVDSIVEYLDDRALGTGRIGIVGFGNEFAAPLFVPYPHLAGLERGLPAAEFVDATDLVERDRLIKSDEEIAFLRRAGEIGHAMAEAMATAEPGMRECEVYAEMVHTLIAEGGEPYIFNFFDSGPPDAADVEHLLHGKPEPLAPTRRTLEHGDLLISEYHAGYGGLLVGVERSVALGEAPDELLNIHEVCLECLDRGLRSLRPGTRFGDAIDAIRAPAREAGMDFVELGMHGHGYGSPDFPTAVYSPEETPAYPHGMADSPLTELGKEDVRLREGMVFGLNIDVYDPDWRNDVGLMFGDTVLITDGSPERLVDTPTELVN